MIDINQDLNIFYVGGSGGFMFLHWILLLDRHFCLMPTHKHIAKKYRKKYQDQSLLDERNYNDIKDETWPDYHEYSKNYVSVGHHIKQEIARQYLLYADGQNDYKDWYDDNLKYNINTQWDIKGSWKSHENWPDNHQTLRTICAHKPYKIYFFCNEYHKWKEFPGKKIMLYTDVKTQLRLAKFKRAWIFYNQSLDNFRKLTRDVLHQAVYHRNCWVANSVYEAFETAEHQIKLQEFLSNPEKFFGTLPNENQKKLLDNWLKLHPLELLDKIDVLHLTESR